MLGRPRVFTDEVLDRVVRSGIASARRVTTRRGAQDLVYRLRAVTVIEQFRRIYPQEAGPLVWLFKPGDMRGETWRHSLLTELGRGERPQWIVAAALQIASLQPPAKEGIRLIRQWRRAFAEAAVESGAPQAEAAEADNA